MRARTGGDGTTTGHFVPQTTRRLFPGTGEMSIVVIGKLRVGGSISVLGAIDAFEGKDGPFAGPINAGGWEFGYDRTTTADPEVYLGMVDATGAFHFGESRGMLATDEGKVHRLVGVGAVAGTAVGGVLGKVITYVNAVPGTPSPGFDDELPTFLPSTDPAPTVVGVLGSTSQATGLSNAGMTVWEVLEIAVVADRAFTADEVKQLDTLITATGYIPVGFADWIEHYRAEQLVNHPLVIGAGGLNAGRGWPAVDAEPILGSVLITPSDWGGSGT